MYLLGIDIGGTKTAISLGTGDGEVLASERMPTRVDDTPDRWLERFKALLEGFLASEAVAGKTPAAAGLSVPGPMSVSRGTMIRPPNMPNWVDVPVLEMVGSLLPCPAAINNDANAAGLAEYVFGAYKGTPDMIYLTMSTGLGGGIISGGRLVQGVNDLGGEIGHMVLDIHGPPCPCGQRGCFELFCGGMNVANRLRDEITADNIHTAILDHAGGDPANIDFRAFREAAIAGDAYALTHWEAYMERLAQGIGTLIMAFNPSLILLGTIAIHAGDFLLEPLQEKVRDYAWADAVLACRIEPSTLGNRIGDLGAIAVATTALD